MAVKKEAVTFVMSEGGMRWLKATAEQAGCPMAVVIRTALTRAASDQGFVETLKEEF